MEIVDWFGQDDFLKGFAYFLNGYRLPSHFWKLSTVDEKVGLGNQLLVMTPRGVRHSTEEHFLSTLRDLVNQWLASGKSGDVECPRERKIPIEVLREFIRRNPPYLGLKAPNGPLTVDFEPSAVEEKDPVLIARDGALFLFLKLMDSPESARLSRCEGCHRYFVREYMPKNGNPIKHGSFCANCKRKSKDRIKLINDKRIQRKDDLVEVAAKWSMRWEQEKPREPWSIWVADKVNNDRACPYGVVITGKWVTRNKSAIEAKAAPLRLQGKE